MTLRQLIQKGSYTSIFNCIHSNYYYKDPEDSVMQVATSYRKVTEELIRLPSNPNTEAEILIKGDHRGSIKAEDIELCLINKKETYALDLVLWEDLIDLSIRAPKTLTPSCIVGHLLYELTFYGFCATDIATERQRLKEIAADFEA